MIIRHKESKTIDAYQISQDSFTIQLDNKASFLWLMNLNKVAIQKAFIYSGHTELSYLQMSWSDYQYDRIEFVIQWNSILMEYYERELKSKHS